MKEICRIQFHTGSKEEDLPGFTAEFPYISTRALIDECIGRCVPWHWHKAVEIFYMESGTLTYRTPNGMWTFPKKSGGMLNSNVLHATKAVQSQEETIQVLHIFDPSFLAGEQGGRIERKYILPLMADSQVEMLAFFPDREEDAEILNRIQEALHLKETEFGYEIKLREALTQVWLLLLKRLDFQPKQKVAYHKSNDKIKEMMIYIHEHYGRKITVGELASSVFLSERESFRVFQNCLHMTPAEYIKNYRLHMASRMLADGEASITEIGQACGLGSSSYFGKLFREYAKCTPLEYRNQSQSGKRAETAGGGFN